MMKLEAVILDKEDQEKLRALNDKTVGLQRSIAMFVENGERRAAELQAMGRELFTGFAAKYKLDLKHVQYVPSDDGTKLEPVTVILREQAAPNGSH